MGLQLSFVSAVNKTKDSNWLLFGYDVPEEPSRIRVRIWRQLKGLGALYPQMSFCILPDSAANRSRLQEITSSLKDYGPKLILRAKATSGPYLHTILTLFKEELQREYRELAEECEEFLDEIDKNLSGGNVTQTEVSELEEALEGLERWFTRINAKDFVRSGGDVRVQRLIKRCHNALLSFSEKAQPMRKSEMPGRRARK